jgi:hypothetical protein
MLPTLAERLREQQARTRSRPPLRQPWPLPTELPTALQFQLRHAVTGPETVARPEPLAPPEPEPAAPDLMAPAGVEPTHPRTRTAAAEALLLLFWALLVMLDGALALASLIDRVMPPVHRRTGTDPQGIIPKPPSAAVVEASLLISCG